LHSPGLQQVGATAACTFWAEVSPLQKRTRWSVQHAPLTASARVNLLQAGPFECGHSIFASFCCERSWWPLVLLATWLCVAVSPRSAAAECDQLGLVRLPHSNAVLPSLACGLLAEGRFVDVRLRLQSLAAAWCSSCALSSGRRQHKSLLFACSTFQRRWRKTA
jgi:hypothetical protein